MHKRDRVARSAEPSGRADPGRTIFPHAIEIYGCIPSPEYFVDYTISKRNSSVPQLLVKNCPVIDEVKFRVNFGFQSRVKFRVEFQLKIFTGEFRSDLVVNFWLPGFHQDHADNSTTIL